MSTTDNAGQEHLTVSFNAADKQLIVRAAGIAGQSLSDFVRSESLRSARELIQEDAVIRLTERGWEQLADLIEATDDDPNDALRRASERNPDVRIVASSRSA